MSNHQEILLNELISGSQIFGFEPFQLAVEKMNAFAADFGRHDYELERYLDFGLAVRTLEVVAKQMPTIEF